MTTRALTIVICVVLLIVGVENCGNCETIKDWDGWCSQLLGVDLFKKYKAWSIKFDDKAIRADFVKKYNDFIVEKIAETYLGGAKPTDEVVKELVRLRIIGVWNEGDDIYLKNGLLIIDEELGINEFNDWVLQFKKYLDIKNNRSYMDDFQYCIYGTINTHFKNFILVGPDGRSVIIPLEFTLKESFK